MKTSARAARLKALGLKFAPLGLTEELVARAAAVPVQARYTLTTTPVGAPSAGCTSASLRHARTARARR